MMTDEEQLIERRQTLRERLRAIEADYRRGLDPDLAEQAVQLENTEVLAGIASATAEELRAVERELARIRKGAKARNSGND